MYKKIKEGGIYWYKGNDEDRHDTSKYYLVMSSDDSEISVFAVPLHKKIRRRYLKEGMILDIPSFGGICTANCSYVHQLNRFRLGDLIATAPDEMFERIYKYLESNDTILMTAFYGLRRSEVLGLRWKSIKLDENIFTIEHTVVKVSTVDRKDSTKTKDSYRSYPLLPMIKDALLKHKSEQERNKELFGNCYEDSDYVFVWPDGTPYSPDFISRKFSKILKKYNMKKIRFHEFRHSSASMLLAMGVTLKDVQTWLGHSDTRATADIYSHLDMGHKFETAEKLSEKMDLDKLLNV